MMVSTSMWPHFSHVLCHSSYYREYGRRGVVAYVEMIQRKERAEQVDMLTHQRWSGAGLLDKQMQTVTGR